MNLEGVTKKIEGTTILEDVTFSLRKNEIVGLIGRNGSGKTTLFRTLSGQYALDGGEIMIDGQSLSQKPQLKENLFYIDEKENFLAAYSLKKINAFYRLAYSHFNQNLYLELMQSNGLPLGHSYRRMSKGMQGLYKMILAIASNADYLLLDEPFDGLDIIVRKKVIGLLLENLSESNRTAIIASHNLNELENIIDRALLIKGRTIAKDYRLETMRENARKIQFVFRGKQVPPMIKQHSKLINRQGRVIVALFEEYDAALEEQIRQLEPLLFEELPLTLEDLFEANLSQESLLKG
ncbi:ABC transporter ATP-binding protein [Enterococcus gallinarum]|uniref:ABC transporter ATP-binding protein n=1 Tax=Enterococcus gallinarum TaxID=1353 RepID=UPI00288CC3E9|nr:ATP-binding cassette domain-containing protein [Enterococcus gallinarum]MDT2680627.1 ATP-binding cassette domain-containing protein [Enterococcus gallinarum]